MISNNAQEVLAYFGLKSRDYPKLKVDFDEMARQIRNPTKTAVCNIIDARGAVVFSDGKPVKIGVEVESEKQIPKSLRFIEWF